MFFCEFFKIFRKIFPLNRTPPDDCSLCLSMNFEKFFRTLLLLSTCGRLLFHVQEDEFEPPDTVKNYFTGAFHACYARTRSSHSKAFIYLKSLKAVCEVVNLSCKMPSCKFRTKTLSHILLQVFVFIFIECITITSSEAPLKVSEHNFF